MFRVLRAMSLPSLALLFAGLLLTALPETVSAHEHRKVANDQAEVVVGWINEPTFVNQPNGVDFRVTNPTNNEPIEGLEKSLKVEVIHGGASKTMDLRARWGQKGAYMADIMPTSTGDYTFRFFGKINGVRVDERFESGPGRFNAVQSLGTIQFPAAQPTTGELQAQLADAHAAADMARTLGIAGIVAGILGLLVAAGAIVTRGRGARAA